MNDINDKKNYTFFSDPGDLEKLKQIGKKEERAVSWMLRKICRFGVHNWNTIREWDDDQK